jgi:hypothetical protein
MRLRAKQSTQINLPGIGLAFVRGPETNDNPQDLEPGQIVTVPDDFVVNERVWEVLYEPENGYRRVILPETKDEAAKQEPLTELVKPKKAPAEGGKPKPEFADAGKQKAASS